MKTICNQHFVKDSIRDKNYNGTIKCSYCNEESHLTEQIPTVTFFTQWTKDFTKLHQNKGCNKSIVPVQEWEAKDFSFGVVL